MPILVMNLANKKDLALVQETYLDNENQVHLRLKIMSCYYVTGIAYHYTYGVMAYAQRNIENVKLVLIDTHNGIHTIIVKSWGSTRCPLGGVEMKQKASISCQVPMEVQVKTGLF